MFKLIVGYVLVVKKTEKNIVLPRKIADATQIVFGSGCVNAVITTAQNNLYLLGAIAVAIAVPQVKGFCFLGQHLTFFPHMEHQLWCFE